MTLSKNFEQTFSSSSIVAERFFYQISFSRRNETDETCSQRLKMNSLTNPKDNWIFFLLDSSFPFFFSFYRKRCFPLISLARSFKWERRSFISSFSHLVSMIHNQCSSIESYLFSNVEKSTLQPVEESSIRVLLNMTWWSLFKQTK